MANTRLLYSLPSDNLSPTGVDWAVNTGTAATGYPGTNLSDGNPAKPAKLNETTGSWVKDFGSAKSLDVAALVMHNFTAGLNVRLQGNAANTWGAPSLDQAFTIPAYHEDGMPVNPWLDLTGIGSRSFQFWRVVVVGVNAAPVALGEVWLGTTKRQMTVNIHWGLEEDDDHPIIEHSTNYKVTTVYDLNTKVRRIRGEVDTTDAGLTALRTWHRACSGRAKPTLIVPDTNNNDALLVRWTDEVLAVIRNFKNFSNVKLGWDEQSRGLPL